MQIPWYQQTEAAVCTYFDVNPNYGLTQKEALKRLAHFGKNTDSSLPTGIDKELLICVLRDGKKAYIPFYQVVPGDIVSLQAGDRVPADVRLVHVDSLAINQAAITGEATGAAKNTFALHAEAHSINQKCMAFAGSYVIGGVGYGVVVERGRQTAIAQLTRAKKKSHGLKGSVIARRLRRFNVLVLRKKSLTRFRQITHVVIDDDISDIAVADIVRKVQLTRNIHCRFVVSAPQAIRLAAEMNAETYDAATRKGNIKSALFITNLHSDTDNSLHFIKALEGKDVTTLWVTNGKTPTLAMRLATISLVVGRLARADVVLAADLFAPKVNSTILTRILYNKK